MSLIPQAPAAGSSALAGIDPNRLRRQFLPSVRPWAPEDVSRILITQAVGAIMLIVSWYVVSGTTDLHKQMLWMRLGIAALLLSGIANGFWLLRGRQLVGLARRYVLDDVAPGAAGAAASSVLNRIPAAVGVDPGNDVRVALDGASRFHRRGCMLVEGKTVTTDSAEALAQSGRTPCELCEP